MELIGLCFSFHFQKGYRAAERSSTLSAERNVTILLSRNQITVNAKSSDIVVPRPDPYRGHRTSSFSAATVPGHSIIDGENPDIMSLVRLRTRHASEPIQILTRRKKLDKECVVATGPFKCHLAYSQHTAAFSSFPHC